MRAPSSSRGQGPGTTSGARRAAGVRSVVIVAFLSLVHGACANPCGQIGALAWLEGEWESSNGKSTREVWRRVSDDTMEGHGAARETEGGEWRVFESLRLLRMGGEIFFVAKTPGNPAPVSFRLTHCTARSARFDNPDHDFPTRIVYRLRADGNISADVSGADGKGFTIDFVPVRTGSGP